MTATADLFDEARDRFVRLNDQLEIEWFERYPTGTETSEFAALIEDTAEALTAFTQALGRKLTADDVEIVDVSDQTDGEPLFELELYGTKIGYLSSELPNSRHPALNDLSWRFTGMGLTRDSVEHDRTLLVSCEKRYVPVWRELQFLFADETVRRAQRDAKSEALSRLAVGRHRTRSREKLPV